MLLFYFSLVLYGVYLIDYFFININFSILYIIFIIYLHIYNISIKGLFLVYIIKIISKTNYTN